MAESDYFPTTSYSSVPPKWQEALARLADVHGEPLWKLQARAVARLEKEIAAGRKPAWEARVVKGGKSYRVNMPPELVAAVRRIGDEEGGGVRYSAVFTTALRDFLAEQGALPPLD